MDDILEKVEELIKEVIYNGEITITKETNLSDIDTWDSLDTADLCMSIEEEFDIELTDKEYEQFDNIGTMIKIIEEKINNK